MKWNGYEMKLIEHEMNVKRKLNEMKSNEMKRNEIQVRLTLWADFIVVRGNAHSTALSMKWNE